MKQIECFDLFGKSVMVDADKINDRYGTYALIIRDGKIVLLNTTSTGKQWPPGGSIEKGETPQEGVIREAREELGVEVAVDSEYFKHDYYFFYNPSEKAHHCHNVYFLCHMVRGEVKENFPKSDHESERPHWRDIKSLRIEDFHPNIQDLAAKIIGDFS